MLCHIFELSNFLTPVWRGTFELVERNTKRFYSIKIIPILSFLYRHKHSKTFFNPFSKQNDNDSAKFFGYINIRNQTQVITMNATENQATKLSYPIEDVKENLFKALIQHNLQAVALVDQELRFVTANSSFCNLLGLPGNNRLNQFHVNVLPFSSDPKFNDLLQSLVTNQIPQFEIETSFKALDNRVKYLKLRMVSLWDLGVFMGGTLFLEDITQHKEAQKLLEKTIYDLRQKNSDLQTYIQSKLQLENFAYLASHDMKEPLRMIGNFSQLLEKRYGDQLNEDGKEYLKYIVGGVKNMNLFINDLLEYSKLDSQEPKIEKIIIENISFLLAREFNGSIKTSNANIVFGDMPVYILGCREKIKSLFSHVISNALKFRDEDQMAEIHISGKEENEYWKFEIQDNGIGIKDEFFEKIFLLFKRLHPRDKYSGSGIGLALCKKIVEQHKGEIWVESKFGIGSKFCFRIKKPFKELI